MYAIELTEQERHLGYRLEPVPNPSGRTWGEPEEVEAVSCRLDRENLVVKALRPAGGFSYWHLRRSGEGWRILSNVEQDPDSAIRRARER